MTFRSRAKHASFNGSKAEYSLVRSDTLSSIRRSYAPDPVHGLLHKFLTEAEYLAISNDVRATAILHPSGHLGPRPLMPLQEVGELEIVYNQRVKNWQVRANEWYRLESVFNFSITCAKLLRDPKTIAITKPKWAVSQF